ncbi:MAG: N-acetylmuramoyl-L-alanine amidase [Gemmatimonadetes bacterium]|nr:N-acetylmuramoyl-L-alanine amidase [Gemmatimonadota bacterium]MXX73179.1 N-acetylmuramoyl-L-alanine amidase [Gemmatimonadota bacterium]MYC90852.1 N-acetylmuramoyl-L-alanine amidase [Gemmatimonadota bacterium]MYG34323.1 N-acetylmuramoyl-L-alanine amidase [Gemmatimonadota bacterium]
MRRPPRRSPFLKAIISAGVGALGMIALAGLVSGAEGTSGEMPSAAVAQDTPVVQQTPPPPRRRSWWSRNRYPGPIPTPEEWRPPAGPVRIALQVGHWRADEAPRELSGLRRNGTSWNGTHEREFNLVIVRRTAAMLEELGYVVDILPAVVPPDYRAHLFLAIHADASNDPGARGYRVSAPRRDATGRAQDFVDLLYQTYGPATGIRRLEDTTRRMRNYYAFNYRRYEHALHPMTIAAIIETGFLTNAGDRAVIMNQPERVARGIVDAIKAFPITPPPGRSED